MSCKFLTEPDWLDYPGSNSISEWAICILLILLAIVLFVFQIKNESESNVNTSSFKIANRVLQISIVILLIAPIVYLISGNLGSRRSLGKITKVLMLMALTIITLAILICQAIINAQSSDTFSAVAWIPSSILLALVVVWGIILYNTGPSSGIQKQQVNWQNPPPDILLTILKNQTKECPSLLDGEEPTLPMAKAALKYYVTQNSTLFQRTFGSSPKMPADKMPNLAKFWSGFITEAKARRSNAQTQSNSALATANQGWLDWFKSFL